MYCPKCGIENNLDQKYCRGCGQSLTPVRLALEGGVDEAITVLRREQSLTRHRVRMVISSLLILIAIATIFSAGRFGISNVQSGAVILIITLILFMLLARKTRRAARALDLENSGDLLRDSGAPNATLNEASTRSLGSAESQPARSVTEESTLELKRDDSRQR
ncbi:MAG TPA: zinc ribbon domain-containing protein [Pyrinomonadaceae bacterium]